MSTIPSAADYVIVGGGSAGCVLANRLSADPKSTVILIEAGADYLPGSEPAAIADSFPRASIPENQWPGLVAERVNGGPARPYEQARVMGGGSSIMGMLALRGLPNDYEEWRQAGADGWGWDDVLPYFRALEHDLDFNGPLHGQTGLTPIRRHKPDSWPPFCRAVTDAFAARGVIQRADMNADFGDGVFPVPMSNSATRRVSTATAYLPANIRARANLRIVSKREVASIVFEGNRAIGVRLSGAGGAEFVKAGEVILSAGAIHSPALLLASGIGPGRALKGLGISPLADRPGVGQNLRNHTVIALSTHLRRDATQASDIRPAFQNCARYSSNYPDCAAGDMFMTILNKTALHPIGQRIGAIMVSVYKSYSTGTVTLDPQNPGGRPKIRFNLLSDPRDLARQTAGIRLALALLDSAPVRAVSGDGFIPTNGPLLQRLARGDLTSQMLSKAATILLDGPAPLRRYLIGKVGMSVQALPTDEDALRRFVLDHVLPVGHVAGTCRIGRMNDPNAVVDSAGRVIGVEGLRIVDASVMPTLVTANTNIPVIMIAEKIAGTICRKR